MYIVLLFGLRPKNTHKPNAIYKRKAGGEPSTWFPPGGLVERSISKVTKAQTKMNNQSHKI